MTTLNQNQTNAGGRPLSYDPGLVRGIIAEGLAAGISAGDLDATFVKEKLCGEHGVKGSIRQEALKSLVLAAHAEIAEAENQALLKALPGGIAPAVNDAVAAAGRELLLIVARQHAASQAIADQRCEELRADKRNAQHRIADLEGDLAEQKEARLALARERDAMAQNLTEAQEELRMAHAEVERLNHEPSGVERLLAELRNPKIRNDIRTMLSDIAASLPPPTTQ